VNYLKRIVSKWFVVAAVSLLLVVTISPSSSRQARVPATQQRNTILMIGDGMGWEMARAAAIKSEIDRGKSGKTLKDFYTQGRGTGLKMQTLQGYALATTYGTTVADATGKYSSNHSALDDSNKLTGASPVRPNFKFNPAFNAGGTTRDRRPAVGNLVGYDPTRGGANPWTPGTDKEYIPTQPIPPPRFIRA
jgi:hypothetical protein